MANMPAYQQIVLAVLFLSFSQIAQGFIQGFSIDDTGDYSRDCELYSGSVTVISCPRDNFFEVVLTEMMANTTVANIQNEYKGAIDEFNPNDNQKDYIRRLKVENVDVSFVKPTNEVKDAIQSLGLIVVGRSDQSKEEKWSVVRYWQNLYSNWVEQEYLFDLSAGPYDDIFVFDDYAIVLKEQNKIYAVYFKNYKGKVVPSNLEIPLYNDLQYTNHKFQAITFENYTGKGDWRMLGAIKTQGALTLYVFTSLINPASLRGAMSRDDGLQTSLLPTTKVSTFVATEGVLVVGCATCNNNRGMIYIYHPQTMKKVKEIAGTNTYRYIGLQVLPTTNADGSSQFWFTSRKSNGDVNLHSVVVFKDYDLSKWYAEEKWDLFGYSAQSSSDYGTVSVYLNWVFYKSYLGQEIGTFLSCQYNQQIDSDFSLGGRSCDKCSVSKPFSYGYDATKCESCNDVASYKDNSPPIVRFLFTAACPLDVEKTVGEDGRIKDEDELNKRDDDEDTKDVDETKEQENKTDTQKKDETTVDIPKEEDVDGQGTVTDGKQEAPVEDNSSGLIIFIAVGCSIIFAVVAGFGAWKVYMACKQNRVKAQPKNVVKVDPEKGDKADKKSKKEKKSKAQSLKEPKSHPDLPSLRKGGALGAGMKIQEQAGVQAGVILSKKKKKLPKQESPAPASIELVRQDLPSLSDKRNPDLIKMLGTGQSFRVQNSELDANRSQGVLSHNDSSRKSGRQPSGRKDYDSALAFREADQNTDAGAGQ